VKREGGNRVYGLTRDHKPNDEIEKKRIIEAGGQIYQATAPAALLKADACPNELMVGPHRVLPGRLSVCRTFGDAEAKLAPNGNPNVVIAIPDIKSFKISDVHDFILMASDGIFDKLKNTECVQCVWNTVKTEKVPKIHQQCGVAVDCVLKNALLRRSLDNVTVLIIAFANMKKAMKNDVIKTQEVIVNVADNKENVQDFINMQEKKNYKKEPAVIGKIVASSTKATYQKHFDFSKPLMERKQNKKLI